jgi:hypothetical protein
MAARDAARFIGSRALTLGFYVLATIGISDWDRDPDSWRLIGFHLLTAAMFLWWAVARSIRHYHEDHSGKGGDS